MMLPPTCSKKGCTKEGTHSPILRIGFQNKLHPPLVVHLENMYLCWDHAMSMKGEEFLPIGGLSKVQEQVDKYLGKSMPLDPSTITMEPAQRVSQPGLLPDR